PSGLFFPTRRSSDLFMAMFPAMLVLTLAWMIGELISAIGTGELLGDMVQQSSLPVSLLPAVVFAVACLMAVATGTSWGSFGINRSEEHTSELQSRFD